MTTNFGRVASRYPLNAFLVVARETGYEISRNVQAPEALIGMSLINAISMACQGLIDVKLPTGLVRPVSQNLLIIAESGERKSTVSSLLSAPFRDADTEAMASHKDKQEAYQAELGAWVAKNKGLRSAIARAVSRGHDSEDLEARLLEHGRCKPAEPRLRYFMRQEITGKAITEALVGDGESIAISTDEGHVLFRSEAMSHLGLLNKLWDSPGVLMRDRADENLLAMNPRVSVSIMTQHEPLKAYLDRKGSVAKGSGHWARYLVGWPQSNMGFRQVIGLTKQIFERSVVSVAPQISVDDAREALIRRGLLRKTGLATLSFPFPIVQEYLASAELLKQSVDEIFRRLSLIFRRPWAQAIQFALEQHQSPDLLVARLLHGPDDVFHTALRLLGRCVANGMSISPESRDELGKRFAAIWGTGPWRTRELVDGIIIDAFSKLILPAIREKLGDRWLIHHGSGAIVALNRDKRLTLSVLSSLLDGEPLLQWTRAIAPHPCAAFPPRTRQCQALAECRPRTAARAKSQSPRYGSASGCPTCHAHRQVGHADKSRCWNRRAREAHRRSG